MPYFSFIMARNSSNLKHNYELVAMWTWGQRPTSWTLGHVFFFLTLYFFSADFFGRSEFNEAKMKLLWVVMLVAGTVFADDDDKRESVGTVVGIDLGTTYSW